MAPKKTKDQEKSPKPGCSSDEQIATRPKRFIEKKTPPVNLAEEEALKLALKISLAEYNAHKNKAKKPKERKETAPSVLPSPPKGSALQSSPKVKTAPSVCNTNSMKSTKSVKVPKSLKMKRKLALSELESTDRIQQTDASKKMCTATVPKTADFLRFILEQGTVNSDKSLVHTFSRTIDRESQLS